jgi:hypothetical protein
MSLKSDGVYAMMNTLSGGDMWLSFNIWKWGEHFNASIIPKRLLQMVLASCECGGSRQILVSRHLSWTTWDHH